MLVKSALMHHHHNAPCRLCSSGLCSSNDAGSIRRRSTVHHPLITRLAARVLRSFGGGRWRWRCRCCCCGGGWLPGLAAWLPGLLPDWQGCRHFVTCTPSARRSTSVRCCPRLQLGAPACACWLELVPRTEVSDHAGGSHLQRPELGHHQRRWHHSSLRLTRRCRPALPSTAPPPPPGTPPPVSPLFLPASASCVRLRGPPTGRRVAAVAAACGR